LHQNSARRNLVLNHPRAGGSGTWAGGSVIVEAGA
jgi:hypothetical protein